MRKLLLSALVAMVVPFPAQAQEGEFDDDVDMMDYDAIVKELSGPAQAGSSRGRIAAPVSDPLANVLFHGGVGLTTTMARIELEGQRIQMDQRGFQAALGIDLFSDHWLAEGTVRSFGGRDYSSTSVSLKEFDLKVYYHDRLTANVGFRVGGGLSARYLSAFSPMTEFSYSTPASVAALGLEYFLARSVSIGAELSARNSLIEETVDRSAVDATLRVDTHF
jgi:hypothetical protein